MQFYEKLAILKLLKEIFHVYEQPKRIELISPFPFIESKTYLRANIFG